MQMLKQIGASVQNISAKYDKSIAFPSNRGAGRNPAPCPHTQRTAVN